MANKHSTKILAKATRQDIIITREFDAPREMVFTAHTNADLYGQWIGPRKFTTTFQSFDTRAGGSWRYFFKDMDGHELAFHGVYHEVKAPERIVGTFEFEGLGERGHVSLETAIFEDLPKGRSRLKIQSVFKSVADRDGMIGSGMEGGMNEGFEKLEKLLATMI